MKNVLLGLLVATAMSVANAQQAQQTQSAQSAQQSKQQMTAIESAILKLIMKVLVSIDYPKTKIDFQGVDLSINERRELSFADLRASAKASFKNNVALSANDFIKDIPTSPEVQVWVPQVNLNFADVNLNSNITANGSNVTLGLNFQKNAENSTVANGLKVNVGNNLNSNLLNLYLKNANINVSLAQLNNNKIAFNGTCDLSKNGSTSEIVKFEICRFSGAFDIQAVLEGKFLLKGLNIKISDKAQIPQAQQGLK